jgi:hypothetical protein
VEEDAAGDRTEVLEAEFPQLARGEGLEARWADDEESFHGLA